MRLEWSMADYDEEDGGDDDAVVNYRSWFP